MPVPPFEVATIPFPVPLFCANRVVLVDELLAKMPADAVSAVPMTPARLGELPIPVTASPQTPAAQLAVRLEAVWVLVLKYPKTPALPGLE